jgi:hypothetical protein
MTCLPHSHPDTAERSDPTFNRIELPAFEGTPFSATATLAFEANHAEDAAPAPAITVEAGRRGTWVLRLTLEERMPAGAHVAFRKVENEFRFDYIHQDYWPDGRGYVTVEDGQGRSLPFACDTALKSAIPAVVTLPREMAPGEMIILRIGDQRYGGAGVAVRPSTYDQAHIEVGVLLPDADGWRPAPDAEVAVRVVPAPPVSRYFLWAPSTVRPGESLDVVALPVDVNNNPVESGSAPEISLGGKDTALTSRAGVAVHASVEADGQGVVRLWLEDRDHDLAARSNPVHVEDEGHDVYWGEFHCHGYDAVELNVLNETTHPDKAYRYGRDVTRLDFMAMGSHIFRDSVDAVQRWWELYRTAAMRYDAPGEYVTFLGCEWRDRTPDGGDRNLVWRDLDAPMPDATWRIGEVYAHLADQGGMVIPHVGGAIALPYHHNPEAEWLCEMVSGHGNFEWFGQAYLQRGYKVGLIGGSDGHKGTPGHPRIVAQSGGRFANILRRRDSGWAGGPVLAVMADDLTREALWGAFRARRTYATTGARAIIDFQVNGALMGEAIAADDEVEIAYAVHGVAPIESVTLIRGDRRLRRWSFETLDVSERFIDVPPDGETYYYLRIEQVDGEILWSSPVWVDSRCGGPNEDLPAWNAPVLIDSDAIADEAARVHLPDLLAYLRTEERFEAFQDVLPYKVVNSPMGDYAVFLCHFRATDGSLHRARIHWFYEFELPRIRFEIGWVHYGREQIMYQPWAAPLYSHQIRL